MLEIRDFKLEDFSGVEQEVRTKKNFLSSQKSHLMGKWSSSSKSPTISRG